MAPYRTSKYKVAFDNEAVIVFDEVLMGYVHVMVAAYSVVVYSVSLHVARMIFFNL